MGRKTGKNSIPDGWEDYSNTGTVINGTRFVAFKVPLKDEILIRKIPSMNKWWGITQLQSSFPQLKLVIDLTNTDRYYSVRDLENRGIRHVKIETEGHVVPGDDEVKQFFQTVDETLDGCDDDEGLVGVHCTHGVNRAEYMICRYMVEILGMEPHLAIQAFDEARGHKQNRRKLLENLRAKAWESVN